ncbi:mandelate racemase [Microbacterium keratanolyticum]|uniref:Mandelate racemase n=1 Tax=Microbacterium keratanolyticum TaxID=67574 RepID=A0A9W6HRA3_9MICO|nr:mandelate racemase [Microbacterium keratanolyticum]
MYRIVRVTPRVTQTDTRIPFRYGIAEMTRAPHAVVEVEIVRDGRRSRGLAAEQLPPKWFTKDPDSPYADDLAVMVDVILHAAGVAEGMSAPDAFQLWRELDRAQSDWGQAQGIPGLLSGLGTALVERAVIDAICRLEETPFADALRSGLLGLQSQIIHPELHGHRFAPAPSTHLFVRHTVGLGDPLTDADVHDAPDHLPVSLQASLRHYGLTHLKIKTRGEAGEDIERLHRILALSREAGVTPRFTIDGNEAMTQAAQFTDWWGALSEDRELEGALTRDLIAVEQPFARTVALSDEVGRTLRAASVPVIIDESDADVDSVRLAMDLGYAGGTYKGCKGVFRGIANAALVDARGAERPTVFTAEDLATLPPLTVPQDLVVAATLGMTHIERNGHHYFGRLAGLGPDTDDRAAAAHPDLYEELEGRVRLRIRDGRVATESVLTAPFGLTPLLNVSALPPLTSATATDGLI